MVQISATIKPRQWSYIQGFAKAEQISISDAIRRLLEKAGVQ